MNRAMMFATLAAVAAAVLLAASGPADHAGVRGAQTIGGDAALRLYADALAAITQRAVFASGDREQVVGRTLAAYLAASDPYSGFMNRDEYARYRALQKGPHGGIGMELERRRDGATLCYPYHGGPADAAGIKAGERLMSIDGTSVAGKPLPVLASLATGREGTAVRIEVASANGGTRSVNVNRARVDPAAVSIGAAGALRVLRIETFTQTTRSEVEFALRRWDRNSPVVIDLRGCGGGDFYAAVDTSMLFLAKGAPIVSVSGREGTRLYSSTLEQDPPVQPVFIWQDEASASAAEVFIGALTGNARAVSVGTHSAGKGSRQDIVELADGSALILTTGYLSTPRGAAFDGRGLAPMRPLAASADTADYVRASSPAKQMPSNDAE
jgi:carboxyl-terminal processing protease